MRPKNYGGNLFGFILTSRREDPHVHVHVTRRYHAPNAFFDGASAAWIVSCARISVGDSGRRPFGYTWHPSNAADEVTVRIAHNLHALAFLSQVPAPDGLVVADTDKVFSSGVEN